MIKDMPHEFKNVGAWVFDTLSKQIFLNKTYKLSLCQIL